MSGTEAPRSMPKAPSGPPPRHILKAQMDKAAEAASTKAEIKRFERINNLQPSTAHALEKLPIEHIKWIIAEKGGKSSDNEVTKMILAVSPSDALRSRVASRAEAMAGPAIGWPATAAPATLPPAAPADPRIRRAPVDSPPLATANIPRPEKVGSNSNGKAEPAQSTPEQWRSTISMLSGQGTTAPANNAKKSTDPLRPLQPHEYMESSAAQSEEDKALRAELEKDLGLEAGELDQKQAEKHPPPMPPRPPMPPGYAPWMQMPNMWAWQMNMMARGGYPGFMPSQVPKEKKDKKDKKDSKDKRDRRDKKDDKEKTGRGSGSAKRACEASRERSGKRSRHRDLSSSGSSESSSSIPTGGRLGRRVPVNATPVPKAKASGELHARVRDLEAKLSVQQAAAPPPADLKDVQRMKEELAELVGDPPQQSKKAPGEADMPRDASLTVSTPLSGCLASTPLGGCLAEASDALIGPQAVETELATSASSAQEATRWEEQRVVQEAASEAASQSPAEKKLHDWLLSLDGGRGSLLQFFDVLRTEFDADFNQIGAVRLAEPEDGILGAIDTSFWEVCGVERMGHRLLLARGISNLPTLKN